jgi:2-dehydro-3-deoxyphosphogluconate aldolase / (4S)-4-hydroxy-2-oxoglutarate aldolase
MPDTAVLDLLSRIRVVPVITIDSASRAPSLAQVLRDEGIGCAEITLRTPASLQAIERAAATSGFVVGAGTVTTPEQVDLVADAGAQFLVSPGLDDEVLERAADRGVLALPGIATASELQRALRRGVSTVKFFPAGALGGLPTIQALSAPFTQARFMPSGGVTLANAPVYLADPAVFAVSGSWMAPREAIATGQFELIARLTRETREATA